MEEYRLSVKTPDGYTPVAKFRARNDANARARLAREAKKRKVSMQLRGERNRHVDTYIY